MIRNLIIIFIIALITGSCNDSNVEPEKEFNLEGIADHESFDKFIDGEWEIVMAEGLYIGAWVTGEDLPMKETIIFNTEDDTFTKIRHYDDHDDIIASGKWQVNLNFDLLIKGRKCIALNYSDGLEIVVNCFPEPEVEHFSVNPEGLIVRSCIYEPNEGGQSYYFEKID